MPRPDDVDLDRSPTHTRRPLPLVRLCCEVAPGDIPDGADVVVYCRGPYCVYADEAVRLLAKKGIDAARLEDEFPEWAEALLSVARIRAARPVPGVFTARCWIKSLWMIAARAPGKPQRARHRGDPTAH